MAQWYSTCLAWRRPWLRSLARLNKQTHLSHHSCHFLRQSSLPRLFSYTFVGASTFWFDSKLLPFMVILTWGGGAGVGTVPDLVTKVDKGALWSFYESDFLVVSIHQQYALHSDHILQTFTKEDFANAWESGKQRMTGSICSRWAQQDGSVV